MKSISIVHLNAAGSGGAYVAAQRLSDALNHYEGLNAQHWIFEYNPSHQRRWANNPWRKWVAVFLHALEKLDFLRFEKSKAVRFAFSHGKIGIDIKSWKVIRQADVIHLHWINKGFISLQGLHDLLMLGKPIVWTCHDMWPFTGGCYHPRGCVNFTGGCGHCQYLSAPSKGDLSTRVFQEKSALLSNEYLQLVTPSQWLKSEANKRSNLVLKNEIAVISNPIDVEYFQPETVVKSKADVKQFHGISDTKRVLLFISANLSNAKKGFVEFAKLTKLLEEKQPSYWHAVVVGDRWPEGVELGISYTRAGLVSSSEILKEWYSVSDLYVTTSHEENLPTTVMEAQCMGVPVAAFAVGGTVEMIEEDLGYCGERMDVISMSKWIEAWSTQTEAQQHSMSERNRSHAIARYSQESVAEQYAKLYLNLTQKS